MTLKRTNLKAAFTLVELLVSIFLLMLVMVGINVVFSSTSATIGVGQAQSEGIRDGRAAQSVLTQDLGAMASDTPSLIISMHQVQGFRSPAARQLDPTPTAPLTWDRDGDGVEENVSIYEYGERSFRADTLSFFARGSFRRQTGGLQTISSIDQQPLSDNTVFREAWIWLGHLALANNDATVEYWPPGMGAPDTNHNNFYANQWIVGRQAILLSDPASGIIGPGQQHFLQRNWAPTDPATSDLSPLMFNSASTEGAAFTQIQYCRYDVARTSIDGFGKRLSDLVTSNGPTYNWWGDDSDTTVPNLFATHNRRFSVNPFVVRPLNAATVSQQAPVFLRGCSSFVVEFAGNFVSQNPDGSVSAPVPDPAGTIDFVVVGSGANARRAIRWYGLPRNTDTGNDPAGGIRIEANEFNDVVPVRDIAGVVQEFERVVPADNQPYGVSPPASAANQSYICAWGPTNTNRPKMIRITFTLEDSLGRLPQGQTFEYVFTLP